MEKNVIVKHEKDRNVVRFTGEMIASTSKDRVTASTMRITTRRDGREYTDYPSFATFDADIRAKVESIPLRVPVTVDAYVSSQKMTPEQKERAAALGMPQQQFVIEDIRLADEGQEDENSIEIVGTIERAYVSKDNRGENVVHFIIASIHEGRYLKRIKVDMYPKPDDGVNYLDFMVAGTRVKVIGYCKTTTKPTDNGMKTYEYINARTISRA